MSRYELTADRLRALIHYDPDTGVFTRLRRASGRRASSPLGSLRSDGYYEICVLGRRYRAHRLAWLYVHGVWPTYPMDHVDGNPGNNRIANLRDVPFAHNVQNRTSKREGIEFRPGRPKPYRVRIMAAGRMVNVGSFADEGAAGMARDAAKQRLHPGYTGR